MLAVCALSYFYYTLGIHLRMQVCSCFNICSCVCSQLVFRCLDLCDNELRRDWKRFPHQFLILLKDQINILTSARAPGFNLAPEPRRGQRGSIQPRPPRSSVNIPYVSRVVL